MPINVCKRCNNIFDCFRKSFFTHGRMYLTRTVEATVKILFLKRSP